MREEPTKSTKKMTLTDITQTMTFLANYNMLVCCLVDWIGGWLVGWWCPEKGFIVFVSFCTNLLHLLYSVSTDNIYLKALNRFPLSLTLCTAVYLNTVHHI